MCSLITARAKRRPRRRVLFEPRRPKRQRSTTDKETGGGVATPIGEVRCVYHMHAHRYACTKVPDTLFVLHNSTAWHFGITVQFWRAQCFWSFARGAAEILQFVNAYCANMNRWIINCHKRYCLGNCPMLVLHCAVNYSTNTPKLHRLWMPYIEQTLIDQLSIWRQVLTTTSSSMCVQALLSGKIVLCLSSAALLIIGPATPPRSASMNFTICECQKSRKLKSIDCNFRGKY